MNVMESAGALALLSWVFAAGAFYMSVRVMRKEVNGIGKKAERRWRELLTVMMENAGDEAQRDRVNRLIRLD
jgi:hypothetical protein